LRAWENRTFKFSGLKYNSPAAFVAGEFFLIKKPLFELNVKKEWKKLSIIFDIASIM